MLIRVEIPIDAPGIDALLRRSFESDAEAKLVHDLREDGFLTLGLVATDDEGQVIGYVAFSPVDVQGEDLQWFTSVVNGKLVVSQNAQADVSFSADASDLLMIAARKQDPDTLFFQRRLVIEGDTELGLYVKNLMDAIELEQMPKALRMMLLQLADFVEAGMKTAPETKQTSVGEPC